MAVGRRAGRAHRQQVSLQLACATSLIGIAVIVMYRNATPAPGAYGVDSQ